MIKQHNNKESQVPIFFEKMNFIFEYFDMRR